MLTVTKIQNCISEIIEVDGGDNEIYRRYSADNWEVLMGESWEPLYNCEEAEAAYQNFKRLSSNSQSFDWPLKP